MLNGPLPGHALLNPVASDRKVRVGIAGLPCVACQADFPFDCGALVVVSQCRTVSVDEKAGVIRTLTPRRPCSDHNCCLNILRMRDLDFLGDGKWISCLARDATSSIFLNAG
jgi:hypothetical protein